MFFEYPKLLWLLIVPLLLVAHYLYLELTERKPHLRVSVLYPWTRTGFSFFHILRHVPFVLRIAALCLIVIALARPRSSSQMESIDTEGIDIHPAPAIALATLIDELNKGKIDRKATIMLNITGGGEKRATEGKQLWYLKPSLIFDLDPNEAEVVEKVENLFKN